MACLTGTLHHGTPCLLFIINMLIQTCSQYTVISSICSNGSFLNLVLQLHCSVIRGGFEPNLFIGSPLIKAYSGCGNCFPGSKHV
ncbi:hypothetical protein AMTRI_Chr09g37460 [Amborella trichopoda]